MADPDRPVPRLVPELDVSDLDASLAFYRELLGFTLVFSRAAERFAYLDREGVNVMPSDSRGPWPGARRGERLEARRRRPSRR